MVKQNRFIALLIVAGLGACATAPVQEMSDARQAIQAAQLAVNEASQDNLAKARQLLFKAEEALEDGEYGEARVNAVAAKEQALQAQQNAAQSTTN